MEKEKSLKDWKVRAGALKKEAKVYLPTSVEHAVKEAYEQIKSSAAFPSGYVIDKCTVSLKDIKEIFKNKFGFDLE